MENFRVNRRQFLYYSGATVTYAIAASSGIVSLVIPGSTYALPLTIFNEHEANTLIDMIRNIYPHKILEDKFYAAVVKKLDSDANTNKNFTKLMRDGISNLDNISVSNWIKLSSNEKIINLQKIETTQFFQQIHSKANTALYNNSKLWHLFGYEGSSAEYGGYIYRGFNDLDWLPEPPGSASPKLDQEKLPHGQN